MTELNVLNKIRKLRQIEIKIKLNQIKCLKYKKQNINLCIGKFL